MKDKVSFVIVVVLALGLTSIGCATKKYARDRVNEKATPLEQRTGELEETSRRNNQDIARVGSDVKDVNGRVDRAQSQADAALNSANSANSRVSATEQSVGDLRANLDKYALQSTATVNFRFDSYQLLPEARQALDDLSAQISGKTNFILEIEGFADSVGTSAYNNQLTEKRADAVRRYLAEQHNIPVFRMFILGFGTSRPVADNHSRDGRAQNRRVEVRLLNRCLSGGQNASSQTSGGTHQ
jgi:outer membrane protein OmpA-like peptidoglycan-associated protein